ncbi:MAG: adenylate/guanylate cyclase domain-containing protein [Cyanobacteriota bacterium]
MNKTYFNIIICSIFGLIIGLTIIPYTFLKDNLLFNIIYKLELKSIDSRYNYLSHLDNNKTCKTNTAIFMIDDNTKETSPELFNDYIFKRELLAKIIEKLNILGVKTIAIDLMFISDIDPQKPENKILLDTISKYNNVILASKVNYYSESTGTSRSEFKTSFDNYFPENFYGAVNTTRDSDEFVRRFKYSFPYKGLDWESMEEKIFYSPSLAVSAVNHFKPGKIKAELINSENQENNFIYYFETGTKRPVRPIYDFFSDNSDETLKSLNLKNKIVLIGNSLKTAHDFFEVPITTKSAAISNTSIIEHSMPGVEIHANIIDTILNNKVIKNFNSSANIIIVILLCLLSGAILGLNKQVYYSLPALIIILCGYITFAFYMFVSKLLIIDLAFPSIQLILTAMTCWAFLYFTENKTRIYVYNSFKKYVSPEVAKIASQNITELSVKRKTITLLFSDVADFTTISENTNPDTLSTMLNKYFSAMGRIIFKHQGTLDKYIGDAVMAFWGAPLNIEDAEFKACIAALEMLEETEKLNKEFKQNNFPEFKLRIGLNTSEAMVGNLGGDLFNYTAIGDGVNLASRLEGVNKQFGTSIIISQFTYEKVKDKFTCRELGAIKVKGKSESIKVFELINKKDQQKPEDTQISELFEQATSAFKSRQWLQAEELFNEILTIKSNDKTSQLYLNQIQIFKHSPPPDNWDGSIEFKEK